MVSRLIRFLFKRNSVSTHLHKIETLIAEKNYAGASLACFIALRKFPSHPELVKLKSQVESEAIPHYIGQRG